MKQSQRLGACPGVSWPLWLSGWSCFPSVFALGLRTRRDGGRRTHLRFVLRECQEAYPLFPGRNGPIFLPLRQHRETQRLFLVHTSGERLVITASQTVYFTIDTYGYGYGMDMG